MLERPRLIACDMDYFSLSPLVFISESATQNKENLIGNFHIFFFVKTVKYKQIIIIISP